MLNDEIKKNKSKKNHSQIKSNQSSKYVTLFIRPGCLIESEPIKITKKNFQTFKINKQNKYKSKERGSNMV